MKKLNNKGITTVEVIICFVLVIVITSSMYSIITSFNEKRIVESKKEKIVNYKNILTKEIQDDFIRVGLTYASYSKTTDNTTKQVTHTLDCTLKDGSKRKLVVEQRLTKTNYHLFGNPNVDDYFMISYGPPTDMLDYPLPNIGERKVESTNKKAYDLSINNVIITIDKETNVLSIQIGFYHPEFATRYGIYIVCPINYVSTGSDETNKFPFN